MKNIFSKNGRHLIFYIAGQNKKYTFELIVELLNSIRKETIIIESVKANSLNPYKYLCYIFKELPGVHFGQYPEFLENFLQRSSGV